MRHLVPFLAVLLLTACATSPRDAVVNYNTPAASSAAMILDRARVMKKPFGIRIDPALSPVQPERFSGFHTGADFEVMPGEEEEAITIPAICSGEVSLARTVNGYGGTLVQRCTIGNEEVTVLYGHLDASSLPSAGSNLPQGSAVGRLGKGYSSETDGERPHLHLAIHRGTAIELRGYVQLEADLTAWMNPLNMLP